MKYYAILFGDEVSGVCTSAGLRDVLAEDHDEPRTLAVITKKDFFSDHIRPERLKNKVRAEIVRSVKLTALP